MIILKTNQNILLLQRLREIDSQYRFELDSIGMVLVKGIKDKGDIKNNPPLEEAFNLAKSNLRDQSISLFRDRSIYF